MEVNTNQIQVELQDTMGSDRAIAEAAWTSSLDYQKKQTRTEDDVDRVVKMLAENKHATPFESVVFRFWIKMPIQTDRQHMTHRIASHNGMSGRYRTMPNEFLLIPEDIEKIMHRVNPKNSMADYISLCEATNNWYDSLLKELKLKEMSKELTNSEYKRCREFFRGVLPQNNMTERITVINLRSFVNYQKLRNSEHAQPEIQLVARLMLEEVKKKNVCPIAIQWLEKNEWDL